MVALAKEESLPWARSTMTRLLGPATARPLGTRAVTLPSPLPTSIAAMVAPAPEMLQEWNLQQIDRWSDTSFDGGTSCPAEARPHQWPLMRGDDLPLIGHQSWCPRSLWAQPEFSRHANGKESAELLSNEVALSHSLSCPAGCNHAAGPCTHCFRQRVRPWSLWDRPWS
jgi:hypothetical protein